MCKCKFFSCCSAANNDSPDSTKTKCKLNRPMSIIEFFRKTYCYNNPENCARYQVMEKLGHNNLPANLLPNQIERAKIIINKN